MLASRQLRSLPWRRSFGSRNTALCDAPPPAAPLPLQIGRVHIPRAKDGESHPRFGFIHFTDRGAAVRAVEDSSKPEMDGATLNVRGRGRVAGRQDAGMGCASAAGRQGGGGRGSMQCNGALHCCAPRTPSLQAR